MTQWICGYQLRLSDSLLEPQLYTLNIQCTHLQMFELFYMRQHSIFCRPSAYVCIARTTIILSVPCLPCVLDSRAAECNECQACVNQPLAGWLYYHIFKIRGRISTIANNYLKEKITLVEFLVTMVRLLLHVVKRIYANSDLPHQLDVIHGRHYRLGFSCRIISTACSAIA